MARDRAPLLVQGTVSERVTRKLRVRCACRSAQGRILGVHQPDGTPGNPYSEYDLRAVSLFAEHAAIAVANARLYEAERTLRPAVAPGRARPLTGAANRVLISDRLAHALARMRRRESMVAACCSSTSTISSW